MTPTCRTSSIGPILLLILVLAWCGDVIQAAEGQLFSEGGSFPVQNEEGGGSAQASTTADFFAPGTDYVEGAEEYQQPNQYQTKSFPAEREILMEQQRQRLANIVEQLRRQSEYTPQELANGPGVFVDEEDEDAAHQRNRNIANEWERLREQMGGETEKPEFAAANNDQKMAAVKKGQSEFVEFVEPHQGNRIKANEWMEKRAPFDSEHSNPFNFFANSGNILFMAYLAICCVGITAGTIGGVYYYNHVRASRNDGDPFNEFTRYSPAGPGKDKLKKGTGSPTFQSGDDTLAYKAQLQHYQQQKQKILGSAPGQVVESVSDNEEDNDEMDHNYSVFECPGLAPTGDLEIQNPNFVGGEKQAEQHRD